MYCSVSVSYRQIKYLNNLDYGHQHCLEWLLTLRFYFQMINGHTTIERIHFRQTGMYISKYTSLSQKKFNCIIHLIFLVGQKKKCFAKEAKKIFPVNLQIADIPRKSNGTYLIFIRFDNPQGMISQKK